MRKIITFMAPVLVLVLAFVASNALAAAKPEAEKTVEPPRPVSMYVEPAQRKTVVLSVDTQGEVRAKTEIDVVPQVSGRIVSVSDKFVEGGSFKAGETLIQIDDSNYRLAVTRAEARVAEARVQLAQEMADARIKEKQWKDWVQEGEPTPLALNKPQVAQAQASMRAAEADLEEARLNLDRTSIRMPFDGRVRSRMTGAGQFVNAGAQLGRVFATDVVEVRLPLTDRQLAELNLPIGFVTESGEKGPQVEFKTIVAGAEQKWYGNIQRINAAIDQQSRLVFALAEVARPYDNTSTFGMPLAVGLFVDAAIEGVTPRDAIVVPRTALRKENEVYVINADNKLEIRTVQVMATTKGEAMLFGGVEPGEQVVTSPVRSVAEGLAVQPISRLAKATETVETAKSVASR